MSREGSSSRLRAGRCRGKVGPSPLCTPSITGVRSGWSEIGDGLRRDQDRGRNTVTRAFGGEQQHFTPTPGRDLRLPSKGDFPPIRGPRASPPANADHLRTTCSKPGVYCTSRSGIHHPEPLVAQQVIPSNEKNIYFGGRGIQSRQQPPGRISRHALLITRKVSLNQLTFCLAHKDL